MIPEGEESSYNCQSLTEHRYFHLTSYSNSDLEQRTVPLPAVELIIVTQSLSQAVNQLQDYTHFITAVAKCGVEINLITCLVTDTSWVLEDSNLDVWHRKGKTGSFQKSVYLCVLLSVRLFGLPGRMADSTSFEGWDYLNTSRDSKKVHRRKQPGVPTAVGWVCCWDISQSQRPEA